MPRKRYLKKVTHEGEEKIATLFEGDTYWVIHHDDQENLKKEFEEQEKNK